MSQAGNDGITSPPVGGTALKEVALIEREGEPRARDIDIAERLGLTRPRNIRKLIENNRNELEAFGPLSLLREAKVGKGRPEEGYLLNEEQSLLVSTLSSAPNAPAVRAMLIRTFVAWRRGHLAVPALDERTIGGINKGVIRKALGEMVPEMLFEALALLLPEMADRHLEADSRAVAIGHKPALTVLIERGVPARRRRAFSQKVSNRLRRFSALHNHPMRISRETGRYLFHVDAIAAWLAMEGDTLIRDHIARTAGQGVLPFGPRPAPGGPTR